MNKLSAGLMTGLRTYCRTKNLRILSRSYSVKASSYQWEPPGLKTEPDIPEYKEINIKLFGHDYPVVENFKKHVTTMARNLDLSFTSWDVPPTKANINTLQFKKAKVVESFELLEYQRIVQIQKVPSLKLPLLLEILKLNCPAGVTIQLAKHTEDDIEYLYIPNYEKLKYEEELSGLDERKKWL